MAVLSVGLLALLFCSCEKDSSADLTSNNDVETREESLLTQPGKSREKANQLHAKDSELASRVVAQEGEATVNRNSSDRKACISNIRSIQQAIRVYQNTKGLTIGDEIKWEEIFGKDKYFQQKPSCPHGGDYLLVEKLPKVGHLAAQCPHEKKLGHRPKSTETW